MNWKRAVREWEDAINSILLAVPGHWLSAAESQVLRHGLILPNRQVDISSAEDSLRSLGLSPDSGHVGFLEKVGAIHLISMGADDGVLLPIDEVGSLKRNSPSIYAALMDGAGSISAGQYSTISYAEPGSFMIPPEVLESMVALSTPAGAKIYVAAAGGRYSDYLRISLHGESVRYASFEDFLVSEMDLMIRALNESVHGRMD